MGYRQALGGAIGLLALLAGCAPKHHAPASPASTAIAPAPPAGAAPGLSLPEPGPDGRFRTINSGLGSGEAIWHVRAALNVAALSCRNDAGITRGYNRLLSDRKTVLAAAYAAENARFRTQGQGALDQHMTRLYNFFAEPMAQPAFCRAAVEEAARAPSVAPADFPAYAPIALDRLEAPILAFYRAYDGYRRDLAMWKAHPHPHAAPPATLMAKAEAEPVSATWRIQIGAFTGERAAQTAWAHARARVPSLAAYEPHYEKVPDRPALVRVQLGSAQDRAGALRLCAAAAAGGFDCLPIARGTKG